jgi:tetratricopeptide (TPR) repeat protein
MARKTIFEKFPRTNTWGAFQCYGDPFYKLTLFSKRIAKTTHYIIPQEAENDIDNLLSKAQIAYFDMSVLHDELDGILQAMRTYKVDTPDLLEKVAMAYLELNDYKKAVALFQEVIQSEPATYTVVTLEKYNNILAKLLLAEYRSGSSPDKNFIEEIDGVINSLTKLLEIAKTSERYSLLGSAYKRKASICKKRTDKIAALTQSAKNYALAHQADKQESMYSLLNWIEIEYFLCQLGVHKWGSMAKGNEYKLPSSAQLKTQLNECLTQLDIKIQQEQYTYWDLISSSNIALCLWFLEGSHTASSVDVIAEKIQRTWTNVGSTNKKMAEIEHLDLLLEFSGLLKTSTVTSSLQILRDHLMRGM